MYRMTCWEFYKVSNFNVVQRRASSLFVSYICSISAINAQKRRAIFGDTSASSQAVSQSMSSPHSAAQVLPAPRQPRAPRRAGQGLLLICPHSNPKKSFKHSQQRIGEARRSPEGRPQAPFGQKIPQQPLLPLTDMFPRCRWPSASTTSVSPPSVPSTARRFDLLSVFAFFIESFIRFHSSS